MFPRALYPVDVVLPDASMELSSNVLQIWGLPNKGLVQTLPARTNLCIIARHKGSVLASASSRRSRRGRAAQPW